MSPRVILRPILVLLTLSCFSLSSCKQEGGGNGEPIGGGDEEFHANQRLDRAEGALLRTLEAAVSELESMGLFPAFCTSTACKAVLLQLLKGHIAQGAPTREKLSAEPPPSLSGRRAVLWVKLDSRTLGGHISSILSSRFADLFIIRAHEIVHSVNVDWGAHAGPGGRLATDAQLVPGTGLDGEGFGDRMGQYLLEVSTRHEIYQAYLRPEDGEGAVSCGAIPVSASVTIKTNPLHQIQPDQMVSVRVHATPSTATLQLLASSTPSFVVDGDEDSGAGVRTVEGRFTPGSALPPDGKLQLTFRARLGSSEAQCSASIRIVEKEPQSVPIHQLYRPTDGSLYYSSSPVGGDGYQAQGVDFTIWAEPFTVYSNGNASECNVRVLRCVVQDALRVRIRVQDQNLGCPSDWTSHGDIGYACRNEITGLCRNIYHWHYRLSNGSSIAHIHRWSQPEGWDFAGSAGFCAK